MKRQTIAAVIFLILSVLIVGTVSLVTPLIENLEFKNYDLMMFLRGPNGTGSHSPQLFRATAAN